MVDYLFEVKVLKTYYLSNKNRVVSLLFTLTTDIALTRTKQLFLIKNIYFVIGERISSFNKCI